MKHFKVKADVFPSTLHVVVDCDFNEFKTFVLNKTKKWECEDEEDDKYIQGMIYDTHGKDKDGDPQKKFFLYLKNIKQSPKFYAELSHELNHFTFKMMDYFGVSYNDEDSEPFCYFQDHFMEQILIKLNKK